MLDPLYFLISRLKKACSPQLLLISRLINQSGFRISHSKVFSSDQIKVPMWIGHCHLCTEDHFKFRLQFLEVLTATATALQNGMSLMLTATADQLFFYCYTLLLFISFNNCWKYPCICNSNSAIAENLCNKSCNEIKLLFDYSPTSSLY